VPPLPGGMPGATSRARKVSSNGCYTGIVTAAVVGMYFSFVWKKSPAGRCGETVAFKDTALAQHLLVRCPWHFICDRQLHGVGVSALVVSPRPKGTPRMPRWSAPGRTSKAAVELRDGNHRRAEKAQTSSEPSKRVASAPQVLIPFVLACIILACNQATGVNSIIGFNTNISCRAPFHCKRIGYVLFTIVIS